jgi:hypothetical protein
MITTIIEGVPLPTSAEERNQIAFTSRAHQFAQKRKALTDQEERVQIESDAVDNKNWLKKQRITSLREAAKELNCFTDKQLSLPHKKLSALLLRDQSTLEQIRNGSSYKHQDAIAQELRYKDHLQQWRSTQLKGIVTQLLHNLETVISNQKIEITVSNSPPDNVKVVAILPVADRFREPRRFQLQWNDTLGRYGAKTALPPYMSIISKLCEFTAISLSSCFANRCWQYLSHNLAYGSTVRAYRFGCSFCNTGTGPLAIARNSRVAFSRAWSDPSCYIELVVKRKKVWNSENHRAFMKEQKHKLLQCSLAPSNPDLPRNELLTHLPLLNFGIEYSNEIRADFIQQLAGESLPWFTCRLPQKNADLRTNLFILDPRSLFQQWEEERLTQEYFQEYDFTINGVSNNNTAQPCLAQLPTPVREIFLSFIRPSFTFLNPKT